MSKRNTERAQLKSLTGCKITDVWEDADGITIRLDDGRSLSLTADGDCMAAVGWHITYDYVVRLIEVPRKPHDSWIANVLHTGEVILTCDKSKAMRCTKERAEQIVKNYKALVTTVAEVA